MSHRPCYVLCRKRPLWHRRRCSKVCFYVLLNFLIIFTYNKKARPSSSKQTEKRKPLPKLVYSLLQDKEIKKRLKDLGLSNQGDRKTLVNRHQRYTLLYNSDCDTSNPRSSAEIIQQVEREEKEEKKISSASISGIVKLDRKTNPKIIEQVHHQYIQQNKKRFDDLIKQIRNRDAAKKTSVESNRIESDDDDDAVTSKALDKQIKTPDNQITEKKPPLKNCISDDDSDDPDAIKSFPDTSDPGKQANENGIETMDDIAFESDTDVENSPVLGRNSAVPTSKSEKVKVCKSTPDMFLTQNDIQIVDSDDGSNDSFSLLSQVQTPDIIKNMEEETNETKRKHSHRKIDSQIFDPDFVPPDSEDVSQDFEIKKPSRNKRKAKKTSTSFTNPPVITEEPRTLRKRSKH